MFILALPIVCIIGVIFVWQVLAWMFDQGKEPPPRIKTQAEKNYEWAMKNGTYEEKMLAVSLLQLEATQQVSENTRKYGQLVALDYLRDTGNVGADEFHDGPFTG